MYTYWIYTFASVIIILAHHHVTSNDHIACASIREDKRLKFGYECVPGEVGVRYLDSVIKRWSIATETDVNGFIQPCFYLDIDLSVKPLLIVCRYILLCC